MDSIVKISVIIPVYNSEKTIIKCIDSAIHQTYPIHEIIIIDDGSTDNTNLIILDYIKNNYIKNIHLYNQVNSGPSSARNFGINKSNGDWIAFLDSDDIWLVDKIEIQILYSIKYPDISLISTQLYPFKNKKNKEFQYISFRQLLIKNTIYTSTVLVKKDVISKYEFDVSQKYSEDYKVWLQIAYSYKIGLINEGKVIYAEDEDLHKQKSLSRNLFEMEKGELSNYIFLYKKKYINFIDSLVVSFFSLIKYIVRLLKYFLFN